MKKLAIIAGIFASIATPAMAQDDTGTERWDGIYAGVNAGGTWISGDMTGYTPFNSYNGFPVLDANDGSISGGVQLGFNEQMGSFGLGAEVSLMVTDLEKETIDNSPGTAFSRRSDFNGSAGPRMTFATDDFALYAKGGLAFGNFEVAHNQNGTLISSDETLYGYMLGGGVDFALSDSISVGVQYEYQDYGNAEIHVPSSGSDIFITPNATVQNLKAVVNFSF